MSWELSWAIFFLKFDLNGDGIFEAVWACFLVNSALLIWCVLWVDGVNVAAGWAVSDAYDPTLTAQGAVDRWGSLLSWHHYDTHVVVCCIINGMFVNTLRLWQNGRHFPDDIFKCIFFNENLWISLKISLKFVPKVWMDNIPALVQIMAWHRPGDKPLSEPMMV